MRGKIISAFVSVLKISFVISLASITVPAYARYCSNCYSEVTVCTTCTVPVCNSCKEHRRHTVHKTVKKHYQPVIKKHHDSDCRYDRRAWISGYWDNGCWVPGHYAGHKVRARCNYGCGACRSSYCCDAYGYSYDDRYDPDLSTGDDNASDYPEMQINN